MKLVHLYCSVYNIENTKKYLYDLFRNYQKKQRKQPSYE